MILFPRSKVSRSQVEHKRLLPLLDRLLVLRGHRLGRLPRHLPPPPEPPPPPAPPAAVAAPPPAVAAAAAPGGWGAVERRGLRGSGDDDFLYQFY